MSYRALAAAFGILLCVAATGASAGTPPLGKSEWHGQYGYNDARTPVPFSWSLFVTKGELDGHSTEPATFGDGSVSNLTANLTGTIVGNRASIIKTYDGKGGVSHSVRYSGKFSADGKELTGTWTVDDISGPFSVDLVSAAR